MDTIGPTITSPEPAKAPAPPARSRGWLIVAIVAGLAALCLCASICAALVGWRYLRTTHATPTPMPTPDAAAYYELKEQALERVLGPMADVVYHSVVPFGAGGAVDLYFFPQSPHGTAIATMELIQPDGTGPKPSRIGTYELVMFTRLDITADDPSPEAKAFRAVALDTMSTFGHYVFETVVNPHDTGELPPDAEGQQVWLVFDEYRKPGVEFTIDGQRHGLLLCIQVFRSELDYAMENGTEALLEKLKEKGYYPYSDLDREPVVRPGQPKGGIWASSFAP